MADVRTASNTGRFEVRVTADSHFAWLRTRLALERTMMSWPRTAVSLIGFGFAIVQFFEHLQQMPGVTRGRIPHAPEYLGLALISCGVLALVISIWQYWWSVRYLWGGAFGVLAGMTKEGLRSPVVAICDPADLDRDIRVFCRRAAAAVAALGQELQHGITEPARGD